MNLYDSIVNDALGIAFYVVVAAMVIGTVWYFAPRLRRAKRKAAAR